MSAGKFDAARARDFTIQSRIALAGYDACHELSACMMAATLGEKPAARILVVGAGGTAREILTTAQLRPDWEFVAIDPSKPMLDLATTSLTAAGICNRVTMVEGYAADLAEKQSFDAANLMGVLHHVRSDAAKLALLTDIARLLKPRAPLVLACNRGQYRSRPLFLEAWRNRWRASGANEDEVRTRLDTIIDKADPPDSEEAIAGLLASAGFAPPVLFFSSLFWGAWITTANDSIS